jgi:hypothetical protein
MKGGDPQGKIDSVGGTELVAPTMETEDNQIPSPVNRDQLVKDQHEDPGLAQENLQQAQSDMKVWYDKKSQNRKFKVGDQVLVLLPMQGNVFQATYRGPYEIQAVLSDLDYVV